MNVDVKDVQRHVERVLRKLGAAQGDGNREEKSEQKALLAELRRGVGKCPGELPKLWGIMLEDMPDTMMREEDRQFGISEPTSAEWAIYLAVTFYAMHQQGHSLNTSNMNVPEKGLGAAVAGLVKSDDDMERVLNRFNIMATSDDIVELAHHLRGIVQLLRTEGIGMDYAMLARDLFFYQIPGQRANVRLAWGEDFYRERYRTQKKEGVENE